MRQSSLALIVVLLAATASARPDQSVSPDLQQFSGVWEGEVTFAQSGTCSINDRQSSTRRTRLALRVEPDGTMEAAEYPPEATGEPRFVWRGQLSNDLKIALSGPASATCGSEARKYSLEYSGKIQQKKERSTLEIKARDAVCQNSRCVFLRYYKLRMKGQTARSNNARR